MRLDELNRNLLAFFVGVPFNFLHSHDAFSKAGIFIKTGSRSSVVNENEPLSRSKRLQWDTNHEIDGALIVISEEQRCTWSLIPQQPQMLVSRLIIYGAPSKRTSFFMWVSESKESM